MKHTILSFLIITAFTCKNEQDQTEPAIVELDKKWSNLIDAELSLWEVWTGVPHTTVEGLEGHQKFDKVTAKDAVPVGAGDPKNIYSVIEQDGEQLLKITGEIYAGLTTLSAYENYHFKAEFKWGEKKWEPRLEKKKDNGILYHCFGPHGAFWNVWMASLECQVQVGDIGDYYTIANVNAKIPAVTREKGKPIYTPGAEPMLFGVGIERNGSCRISVDNEKPEPEWNTIEVICVGGESIHVVNGVVNMHIKSANKVIDGVESPLTSGRIQIQSEGAESYYKNMQIKAAKAFPKKYVKQLK